jgi:nucleoside-diphosphate-sugar epimerase
MAQRIFVAGGTGAVGRPLVAVLRERGHHVVAMSRSEEGAETLRRLGAEPIVCDVFDADRLSEAVVRARPDVVVNQLTDLPKEGLAPRRVGEAYVRNNRVRSEGTQNLVAAALACGARRYVGQSGAFFYAPVGSPVKDESAPFWTDGPEPYGEASRTLLASERAALDSAGLEVVVLRYGGFYGPRTWFARDGAMARQMAKRQLPNIGRGEGVTSFVHVDDAADVCAAFVERGAPGIYNVADDEPATANAWMPVFADAIGAPRPFRVPTWLARLLAGSAVVEWITTGRGADNSKVKQELGWTPRWRTWREGFRSALS